MVKITAVAILVFTPLVWGILMVPLLDFFESRINSFFRKRTDDR